MDDLSAFDRQLASAMVHRAGPVRPVDEAAIFTTINTTQSPKWRFQSMFSATKFVVAGTIVALFGGFLLIAQPFEQQGDSVPAATSAGPGTFSPTGSLAKPRADHTATLLPDGRVLVVGGFDVERDHNTNTAEIWDPDTDTFGPTGSLAEGRRGHTAMLLPDDRVLVVGGTTAEVWDPSTGAFSPAGSTVEAYADLAMLLGDGRVLVVGDAEDDPRRLAVEVWDPETSAFSPAGTLPVGYSPATGLADGRVLIVGGGDDIWSEVWDPVTDTFSPSGSPVLDWISSATLLADGRVLTTGEYPISSGKIISAEVWDPATRTFGHAGSFDGPNRDRFTVTALADGRALIAGGCSDRQACNKGYDSAEVWDPDTETFHPTGSLSVPRSEHTATALPDGRVLVIGGWEGIFGFREISSSAEVWEAGDS